MGAEEKVRCTHCGGSHLSLVYSLFDCRLPASWLTGRGDGGGGARTLPLWRGRLQLARARVHLLLTLLPLSCWWMAGLTHLPPVSLPLCLWSAHTLPNTPVAVAVCAQVNTTTTAAAAAAASPK